MIFELINTLSEWFFFISLFIGSFTILAWALLLAWITWVQINEKRREIFEGYVKRSKFIAMRMCCLSAIELIENPKYRTKMLEQERRIEEGAKNGQ